MDHEDVSASDPLLFQRAKKLVEAKRPFVIRADQRYRHSERLIRMLKLTFEGGKPAWFWTRYLDAFHSGWIFACWGAATDKDNYTWHYEYTGEGVDLFFDPPGDDEGLTGMARQLPKQRG